MPIDDFRPRRSRQIQPGNFTGSTSFEGVHSKKGTAIGGAPFSAGSTTRPLSAFAGSRVKLDLPPESESHHGKKPPHKGVPRRKLVKRALLSLLVCAIIAGVWFGWGLIGNLDKVFHGNVFADLKALFGNSQPLKGESQGRVNILLAGDSVDRTDGGGGGDLTDSIMVVSLDTKTNTGFMLSIPRDLWVDIPALGYHQKINAAHTATKFSQANYPSGGMGQLEQIVQTDLGIPIDYYALVNYTAFRDAVNAVGGINITIQSSDPRGLYDPSPENPPSSLKPIVKFQNGPVTLNGQQALDLARARGDAYGSYGYGQGDFVRTQYQRAMLTAVEQKAGSIGVLSNPVRVSQLFNALGNNLTTDMTLSNALRAATLLKKVNVSSLQSATYSYGGTNPLLKGYTTYTGQSALIPTAGVDDFTQLQQYYQQLVTSENPPPTKN